MLLVSIHDVTPALESRVIKLWDLCSQHGLTPALFVVPNWHGAWPLEHYPAFTSWLRSRSAEGAEMALHGERHDEEGLSRTSRDSWRAWGRTDREGEFLTLDGGAARQRLNRALLRLQNLGLEPTGFVAPAWLARDAAYDAAASAGLRFSEDATDVILLPSKRRIPSPVVRWSARTAVRAWGSVAVARARWVLQRGSEWPRIALHPGDLDHGATSRSIARALERWLGRHRPGRYRDLAPGLQPA